MESEQQSREPVKCRRNSGEKPDDKFPKRYTYDEVLLYGLAAAFVTGCAAMGAHEGSQLIQNNPQTFTEVIQRSSKALSLSIGAGGAASATWVTLYTLVRPLPKDD